MCLTIDDSFINQVRYSEGNVCKCPVEFGQFAKLNLLPVRPVVRLSCLLQFQLGLRSLVLSLALHPLKGRGALLQRLRQGHTPYDAILYCGSHFIDYLPPMEDVGVPFLALPPDL